MAYKFHKEPHELFSNRARLKEPTEEQKKLMLERRKIVRDKLKKIFPNIDAITSKPK